VTEPADEREPGPDSGAADRFFVAKLLAPYLLATALVSAALGVALVRQFPSLAQPPVVVSFDVVQFANAQRAVASAFLREDQDHSQAHHLLHQLPQRTREAIARIAGPDALVVVRQAVVQGQTRDITVEVLRELGLPTDVPTFDGARFQLDVAPTILFRPPPERVPAPIPGEGADPSGRVLP
jgi:hypothetical protein